MLLFLYIIIISAFDLYGSTMERLRFQRDNILGRTDDFYVRLSSDGLRVPNTHSRFLEYFPYTLQLAMDYEVCLHKLVYPRNWRTFPLDMKLWISVSNMENPNCDVECRHTSDQDFDSDCEDHHQDENNHNIGCNNDCHEHHHHTMEIDDPEWKRVSLPEGCYRNANNIFDAIISEMRSGEHGAVYANIVSDIEFKYLPSTNKVYIFSKKPNILINLSSGLADLFGFETRTFILNTLNCCSTKPPTMHMYFFA